MRLVLNLPPSTAWGTRTQTLSVLGGTEVGTFTTLLPSVNCTFDPVTGNTATLTLPTSVTTRYVRLNFTANTGWPASTSARGCRSSAPDPPRGPRSVVGVHPSDRNEHAMSWSITGAAARRTGRASRRAAAAVVAVTAAAVGLSVLTGGTALAGKGTDGASTPVATRAALDPSLVAGRGASVDFVEQEAENAVTNGAVIGPDRTAYTLPHGGVRP